MMPTTISLPLSELDYRLPAELIAQEPAAERDGARLMVVDRASGVCEHRAVRDLPSLLARGDLLLLNDTKVIAARLRLAKHGTGGRIEALLIEHPRPGVWEALVTGSGKLKPGTQLVHPSDPGRAVLEALEPASTGEGRWLLGSLGEIDAAIEALGEPPLPPYIDRPDGSRLAGDTARYQTIYAREPGSSAAPTAGLHFTPGLLSALGDAGIATTRVTLHVGPGTFMPVKSERVEDHRMHPERYAVTPESLGTIRTAHAAGRRLIATGTSCVRVLETLGVSGLSGEGVAGTTSLFITPGFHFALVGGMLTNFHQPRSTPYALVAALAGLPLIRAAYAEAITRRYRFLSYGDAMLIL